MKSEAVPPLADVCALLETEVEGLSRKYRAAKRRTDKGATAALLAVKYQEVLRVLMRILWQKEQRKKLMELLLPNGNGRSRRSTDQRRLARLDQLIEITSFLTLDIKALYLWCYEILEVFRKTGIRIDLSELDRIARVRHTFITHVARSEIFRRSLHTQGGILSDSAQEQIEILFHPFLLRRDTFRGLRRLVKEAIPHLPALRDEKNYYEQVNLLYRNYNTLPRGLQRKVGQLIGRLGVKTEPPNEVAWVLLDVLRRYRKAQRV